MDASASRRFRNNLTFSSTLLDEIYRSIDEQSTVCSETSRKKQNKFVGSDSGKLTTRCFNDDERRACLHQKWMENKVCEKPVVGRSSAADRERSSMRREPFCFNSSSSSCDFSRGGRGGFSSVEAESLYGVLVKPKPIRTSVYQNDEFTKREKQRIVYGDDNSQGTAKHEGNFVNTKSKALKIYNDLKKVKQPISPGGRLAAFVNSLFKNKKSNISTATAGDHVVAARSHLDRKSKSANASTCSSASASSFSRSCLQRTTSSRGKFSNDMKKSVRFYPVSVIDDEETDSNSNEFTESSINKGVKLNLSDENNRISEAARNLLKNYQKKVECELDSAANNEDENQFNDGKSDSSSDLFELHNLSPIRIHSHQEELPLYATTNVHNNRALNGGDNLFM